ncbi:MAG: hypothetical protein DMG76_08910 [Acidobacteria bacterium]|nr:MAG: hypothetical protein DMG76_08910 [Acidobacteriota bacterium]
MGTPPMAGLANSVADLFISEPGGHYKSTCLSGVLKTRLLVQDSGSLGLAAKVAGAVAMWCVGHNWYPLALIGSCDADSLGRRTFNVINRVFAVLLVEGYNEEANALTGDPVCGRLHAFSARTDGMLLSGNPPTVIHNGE